MENFNFLERFCKLYNLLIDLSNETISINEAER